MGIGCCAGCWVLSCARKALTDERTGFVSVQLEAQVKELQNSKASAALHYKAAESRFQDSVPALQQELRQKTDLFEASAASSQQQIVRARYPTTPHILTRSIYIPPSVTPSQSQQALKPNHASPTATTQTGRARYTAHTPV